jgi:ribosome-associated heat shock protein Hsp15
MPAPAVTRIDKWLWCVRIFKTRSQATDACRSGKVRTCDHPVKPSHEVKTGEIYHVTREDHTHIIQVKDLPASRVGAKLVPEYFNDLTPPEMAAQQAEERKLRQGIRPAGIGRPTKKDRRTIDKFRDG